MLLIKARPKPRIIRSSDVVQHPPKRAASVVVEQSHARHILNMPQKRRAVIIKAIQEGNKIGEIARFVSEEGWLTVSENTFKQYLMAFKRLYPEMCEGNDSETLDHLVDGKRPAVDEEVELERLLRMQKVRLKVGVDFELRAGFLNKEIHKDVIATKDILESLATLRGKRSGAGRPSNGAAITNEAAESLRKVDVGEAAQERLVSAVSGLIGLVNGKNRTQTQT